MMLVSGKSTYNKQGIWLSLRKEGDRHRQKEKNKNKKRRVEAYALLAVVQSSGARTGTSYSLERTMYTDWGFDEEQTELKI